MNSLGDATAVVEYLTVIGNSNSLTSFLTDKANNIVVSKQRGIQLSLAAITVSTGIRLPRSL